MFFSFRLETVEIPGGLRVFIKSSDVDRFLTVEVKESQNDEWEDLKSKVKFKGRDLFYFDYMSPRDKHLDFRILTTRKSQSGQQPYLLFEINDKLVFGEYHCF